MLSATINRYAWGTLRPRDDGQICINSLDFGTRSPTARATHLVYDGEMDLAKAAHPPARPASTTGGYDLFLHTDAPPGSGLGSSSAMMVALVGLLKEFRSLPLTDYEVAELAYAIERIDLGHPGRHAGPVRGDVRRASTSSSSWPTESSSTRLRISADIAERARIQPAALRHRQRPALVARSSRTRSAI